MQQKFVGDVGTFIFSGVKLLQDVVCQNWLIFLTVNKNKKLGQRGWGVFETHCINVGSGNNCTEQTKIAYLAVLRM